MDTSWRLGLAAHCFFANGGRRLHVQRVFVPTPAGVGAGPDGDVAAAELPVGGPPVLRWRARRPGAAGARIRVVTRPTPGAHDDSAAIDVEVHLDDRVDTYAGLVLGAGHERSVATVMRAVDPADVHALVWLDLGDAVTAPDALGEALLSPGPGGIQLVGGTDGAQPTAAALATGLAALADAEDVSIVALPDGADLPASECVDAAAALVAHCEEQRFRVAIVDPPAGLDTTGVLEFRSRFESSRAAVYHPWVLIADPDATDAGASDPVAVPPSGAVAGVYARVDLERGVHAPPANQALAGVTGLAGPSGAREQELLGPAGVNALRSVAGRGHLVRGGRTMSSDPEWRYVNVRRLFIYLEHSIDRGTQWAVFEPNGERLWTSVRRAVEDFLLTQWRSGALAGQTPDEAFFVRCDRTTMSQNDLDNGRLVVLVGVAPLRPAEFVVLRIGQWTADGDPDRPAD